MTLLSWLTAIQPWRIMVSDNYQIVNLSLNPNQEFKMNEKWERKKSAEVLW